MESKKTDFPYDSSLQQYGGSLYALLKPRVMKWLGLTKHSDEVKMVLIEDEDGKSVKIYNPAQSEKTNSN